MNVLKSLGVHAIILSAVAFALYPVLWVVSLALSPHEAPGAIPWPSDPSLDALGEVVLRQDDEGTYLFLMQTGASLLVAFATAFVAILIATPAAYALSSSTAPLESSPTSMAPRALPRITSSSVLPR